MSDVAWLFNYDNYSVTNVYGMSMQTLEFDGVERFWLREKRKRKEISDEELKRLETINIPALRFYDDWEERKYIKNLPTKLFKHPDMDYSNLPKATEPYFRITGGYLILGQKLYDILSQFNLGKTHFSQVYIYDIETGEQLSDIPYYFINVAETFNFLDVENSREIALNEYQPSQPMRWIREPKDDDIRLSGLSQEFSIDLWHEKYLKHSLFFSDRLTQALLAAGFTTQQLALIRCVVA